MAKCFKNWISPTTLIVYRHNDNDGTALNNIKITAEYDNGMLKNRFEEEHNMTVQEIESVTDGSIDEQQCADFISGLNAWSEAGTCPEAPAWE